MPDRDPHLTPAAQAALDARRAREAQALRANLRRRRQQVRARTEGEAMTLSGCIEMLFVAEHADYPSRIRACRAAGLGAVEFWRWRDKDIEAIAAASRETGLPVSVFSVEPGGRLVDPATHGEFLQGLRETIPVAARLGTRRLIVLSGDSLPGVDVGTQREAVVAALRVAAPIAADAGVTLLLEPLNTRVDHVGCFLDHTADGLDIVDAVAHPAVRLLYDIYHSAMMAEDPAVVLAGRGDRVGYVHAADTGGRHQPGSGTIDWGHALGTLAGLGYGGPIGLEFRPAGATDAALRETLAKLTKS